MKDILNELIELRKADAIERERRFSYRDILRTLGDVPEALDFVAPFKRRRGTHIIAELKKASPSEGIIRRDFHPLELAEELVDAGAAALSVLCEPHKFLGSEEYLRRVRMVADVPILCKDFISTRYQVAEARMAGADAILLIAAALTDADLAALRAYANELGMAALCETHTAKEVERAVNLDFKTIGVNCRDLRDFSVDGRVFAELVAQIPRSAVKIAESGMHTREDILAAQAAGANGFLVGTALMRADRPGLKLKELL